MKYINITTPDNIDIEYRLAGAGSRVAAATIDFLIQIAALAIIIIISLLVVTSNLNFIESITNTVYIAFIILVYFVIFMGYFLVCEIVLKGQTIGKKILKLRTIRQNGQPITFIQSIIRNLIRIFIDNQGIGLLMIFFTKEHKRLGDMAGGTIVISENLSKISSDMLLYSNFTTNQDRNVITTQYLLDSGEKQIIREYFARKDEFIDSGVSALNSMKKYFANKFELQPIDITVEFLVKILHENV